MYNVFTDMLMVLGGVFLLLIASTLAFFVLRAPVLEGRLWFWLFPFFRMAAVPSDYWDKLLHIPIDANAMHRAYKGTFQHRYIGNYALLLEVELDIPQPVMRYDIGAIIKAKFYVEGKEVLSVDLGREVSPISGGPGRSSFLLFNYEVPQKLPRATPISYEFQVSLADGQLEGDYGKAALSIRKWNDL